MTAAYRPEYLSRKVEKRQDQSDEGLAQGIRWGLTRAEDIVKKAWIQGVRIVGRLAEFSRKRKEGKKERDCRGMVSY